MTMLDGIKDGRIKQYENRIEISLIKLKYRELDET